MQAEDRKTTAVHCRLNSKEKAALGHYAERHDTTQSKLLQKFVRELVNDQPDLMPTEIKDFKLAVRQLAGISRNLNQLTRAVNSGKWPERLSHASYWAELQDQVGALRTELDRYIDASSRRWVRPQ